MSSGNLVCRCCGAAFIFSTAQREFLAEHGCDVPPLYCGACFAEKLRTICEMPGEKRVAVCSVCGEQSKLCFVPSQDRPVLCQACHQKAKSE